MMTNQGKQTDEIAQITARAEKQKQKANERLDALARVQPAADALAAQGVKVNAAMAALKIEDDEYDRLRDELHDVRLAAGLPVRKPRKDKAQKDLRDMGVGLDPGDPEEGAEE